MCQLSSMTKSELQAKTKSELIELALAGVTYQEIVTRETTAPNGGEVITLKIWNRSALNNDIVSGQKTKKKYFDAPYEGVIHKIFITNYGPGGVETDRYCIVHNREGGVKEVTQEAEPNGGGVAATKSTTLDLFKQPEPDDEQIIEQDELTMEVAEVPKLLGIPVMSKKLWSIIKSI